MPVNDYLTHQKNELPKNWSTADFSETILHQRVDVGNVKKQNYMESGKFPIIDQGQEYIAGYSNDETLVYKGELPIIIFGDHTRVFKFIDFPFICGADGTKVLQPNQEIVNPEYFYFALKALDIPSKGYNRHYRLLKEQKIPVPPLPEQRTIAHVLSTVRQAIDATEGVIAAARELKRSMMKHLFSYGPVPVDQTDKVELKETEVGEIPKEWEVIEISELANVEYGKANPRLEGTIPLVGSGGVYGCTEFPLVDFPTIIVGRKGTAGKAWLMETPSYPSDTTFYLDWKKEIDIDFLYNYLNLYPLSGEHAKTTLPSLTRTDLENKKVPFPSQEIQYNITGKISSVDEKIKTEIQHKFALEELFNSLLRYLMTGKIRVGSNHDKKIN